MAELPLTTFTLVAPLALHTITAEPVAETVSVLEVSIIVAVVEANIIVYIVFVGGVSPYLDVSIDSIALPVGMVSVKSTVSVYVMRLAFTGTVVDALVSTEGVRFLSRRPARPPLILAYAPILIRFASRESKAMLEVLNVPLAVDRVPRFIV